MKATKLGAMKSFLLSLCMLCLVACGPSTETVDVVGTPASPASDGKVVVEPHPEFGNGHITIELTSVTPPERMNAPAHFFVVWQKIGADSHQIGQLEYNAEKREAHFEGSVLSGPFELIVTAETTARPQMPSGHMLMVKSMHGQGS